jgi:hypothetical protein
MIKPPDSITGKVFRNEEHLQDLVVSVETGEHSLEFRELRRSTEHPGARTTCSFTVGPDRYRVIDVRFMRGADKSRTLVEVESGGVVHVHHNKSGRSFQCRDTPLLFDGPGALFDYVNVMMILGLPPGTECTAPVHIIDHRSGELIRTTYHFKWNENRVAIHKGVDVLADSELVFIPDTYAIAEYLAGGFRTTFDFGDDGPDFSNGSGFDF